MRNLLARIGGSSLAGVIFWPALDDDFWKALSVAVPAIVSIVVSLLGSWKKLRELLVHDLTALVRAELKTATDEEIERIKNVIEAERERLAQEVTDQVWYRIDTINKLTGENSEVRGQKSEVGAQDDKAFDLQELAR